MPNEPTSALLPDKLIALAERCEAAEASEQNFLLLEAWHTITGPDPVPIGQWPFRIYVGAYHRMLTAEAFESAALTLVPEGAFWWAGMRGENLGGFQACCQIEGPLNWREASTPALALCAAALRARASMENTPGEQP